MALEIKQLSHIRATFLNYLVIQLGNSISIEKETTRFVLIRVPTDYLLFMLLGLVYRRCSYEFISFDEITVNVGWHEFIVGIRDIKGLSRVSHAHKTAFFDL